MALSGCIAELRDFIAEQFTEFPAQLSIINTQVKRYCRTRNQPEQVVPDAPCAVNWGL